MKLMSTAGAAGVKAPLEHVRVCETHWEPDDTEVAWYAVTLEPSATVLPLNVHAAAVATGHGLNWYEPESVPFEQVLVSCVQMEPYATDPD